jgi:hypothetical protein
LSNQRQIVFFGFMSVCSLCAIGENTAVSDQDRISDIEVAEWKAGTVAL